MIACVALFSALLSRLTALACGSTWVTSFRTPFSISTEAVDLQRWHVWCHMKLRPAPRIFVVVELYVCSAGSAFTQRSYHIAKRSGPSWSTGTSLLSCHHVVTSPVGIVHTDLGLSSARDHSNGVFNFLVSHARECYSGDVKG